jgi:transcription elongation factor Elf1
MKCPHCNEETTWSEWGPLDEKDDNYILWCVGICADPYSQDLEIRQLMANYAFYVCPKCGETVT